MPHIPIGWAVLLLYAFGHRHWRKVARLFQRHLRFTDITPKILRIQIFDLEQVDDIQIRILPIKLLKNDPRKPLACFIFRFVRSGQLPSHFRGATAANRSFARTTPTLPRSRMGKQRWLKPHGGQVLIRGRRRAAG
jgi:hypothetical protein